MTLGEWDQEDPDQFCFGGESAPVAGDDPEQFCFSAKPVGVPGYELLNRLDLGDAEVWRGEGPGGFPAALWFTLPAAGTAPDVLEGLEALRRIRHPNLLAAFGSWQVGHSLVMVTELPDLTLWERFLGARAAGAAGIPRDDLLDYLAEAARGIDYLIDQDRARPPAGDEGEGEGEASVRPVVPHGDISPHTIMLVGGGVKVANVGPTRWAVARPVFPGDAPDPPELPWDPAYAAPERFAGLSFVQSDQYSLAVTYCQMRGGRLPYPGTGPRAVAGRFLGPPDLSMLPPEERPAVGRALSRDAGQRWPSCRAFIDALTADVGAADARRARLPVAAPPEGRALVLPGAPPRFRSLPVALTASAALAGVCWLGGAGSRLSTATRTAGVVPSARLLAVAPRTPVRPEPTDPAPPGLPLAPDPGPAPAEPVSDRTHEESEPVLDPPAEREIAHPAEREIAHNVVPVEPEVDEVPDPQPPAEPLTLALEGPRVVADDPPAEPGPLSLPPADGETSRVAPHSSPEVRPDPAAGARPRTEPDRKPAPEADPGRVQALATTVTRPKSTGTVSRVVTWSRFDDEKVPPLPTPAVFPREPAPAPAPNAALPEGVPTRSTAMPPILSTPAETRPDPPAALSPVSAEPAPATTGPLVSTSFTESPSPLPMPQTPSPFTPPPDPTLKSLPVTPNAPVVVEAPPVVVSSPTATIALSDQLASQAAAFLSVFGRTARTTPQGYAFLSDARTLQGAAMTLRQASASGDTYNSALAYRQIDAAWRRMADRASRISPGRVGPNIQQIWTMAATATQIGRTLP